VVSETTVKTHVGRLLMKLGCVTAQCSMAALAWSLGPRPEGQATRRQSRPTL
jgi:DNA-binding NarL/FixJ family response regulator